MAEDPTIPAGPPPSTGKPQALLRQARLAKISRSSNLSQTNRANRRTCMNKVSLLSLATALPPDIVEQGVAKSKAREFYGGSKAVFDRLSGVFDNAGIAQRHIVAPTDWYEGHHGWKERNRLYLDASDALFQEAAGKAIELAGLKPADIDGVVMVSTTGIATPSLEARNGPTIGLRDDIRRVPVFGLGCAGGGDGLATAPPVEAG